jgi:hypothetical protein
MQQLMKTIVFLICMLFSQSVLADSPLDAVSIIQQIKTMTHLQADDFNSKNGRVKTVCGTGTILEVRSELRTDYMSKDLLRPVKMRQLAQVLLSLSNRKCYDVQINMEVEDALELSKGQKYQFNSRLWKIEQGGPGLIIGENGGPCSDGYILLYDAEWSNPQPLKYYEFDKQLKSIYNKNVKP